MVADACKFDGDLSPECIKTYYEHLDEHNHLEWSIWLSEFFESQLMLAIFGPLATFEAPMLGTAILFTAVKPDLSEAPWDNINPLKALWYQHITGNAWLI